LHDLRLEVADQEMLDRFAEDWRTAGLDDATQALLAFAEKLTATPSACTADDIERLRVVGWDDCAVHDAVQVCAYFNYINRVAGALGVHPEDWIDEVGRPLE
jgi:uncharacterized peroxidase-related enzyme